MRQTVIIAGFFPPPVTGQGLATARVAELLSESHDVITVNLREGETAIDLRILGRLLDKVSSYRRAGRRLSNVLQQHPDAVVLWTSISPEAFGHFRDLITVVRTFGRRRRVYAVVHWGRFSKLFRSPLTAVTARRLIARLTGVVFLSANRSEECADWVQTGKRFVIPNTLDLAVVCSDDELVQKQSRSLTHRPVRLLFLSNMIQEKGYEDLLEATGLLSQRGVSVHATFAGQWISSEDRSSFERRATELGIVDQVTHLGLVIDRGRIKTLHLQSDIFVLPSYMVEGQPLAILEAMNAGSPIVSTRIGGTEDMIASGREGVFVAKQSPSEIADAVVQLSDPEVWLDCSQAARLCYQKNYSEGFVRRAWGTLVENSTEGSD